MIDGYHKIPEEFNDNNRCPFGNRSCDSNCSASVYMGGKPVCFATAIALILADIDETISESEEIKSVE